MSNPLYYPNRDMLASGFPTNWTLLKRLMWVRIMQGGSIAPTYETVTGNPVSFTTVRSAPLRQLSVAFSPVQSGTGDPSPDNVRPILGWDSLTVYHSGADTSDPQTISITIGQTVYGGTLNVLTGVVTVTHSAPKIRDFPSLAYYSSGSYFRSSTGALANWDTGFDPVSETYKSVHSISSSSANNSIGYSTGPRLAIKDSRFTTANALLEAVGDTLIVLKLKEPFTIQLAPEQVAALKGTNTMWSDANGDLTVTYAADPATTPIVGTGKVGQAIIGG